MDKILKMDLHLFEGGAAAGASGASGDGAAAAAGVDTASSPVAKKGKTGAYDNVKFGIQDEDVNETVPDAGEQKPEDKRKTWDDLVKGEYKEFFTQDTQNIINRRFKETKGLEEQLSKQQSVIDKMYAKYNVNSVEDLDKAMDADTSLYEEQAEEAGLSVEQYKHIKELEAQNARLMAAQHEREAREQTNQQTQKWLQEADELKKGYPSFDVNTEVQNPQFIGLLKSGVPMQHAFEVIHLNDIKAGTAAAAEKAVTSSIRSKGMRPRENGAASGSAFTIKADVSQLTRADRAEAIKRAARGEMIRFS